MRRTETPVPATQGRPPRTPGSRAIKLPISIRAAIDFEYTAGRKRKSWRGAQASVGASGASKPQVVQPRVARGLLPCRGAVSRAIVAGAEPASAPDHFLRAVGRPLGIDRGRLAVVIGRVPVRDPFPDIAHDVVKPVAVRRKALDRRDIPELVFAGIAFGKNALPDVRPVRAVGGQIGAPGEFLAVEPAADGIFELRLGRQTLARPLRVGHGVVPRNVDDRVVFPSLNG